MNKLRKSLVISVMVLTVLATSGVFNISAAKASASAGDLVKISSNSAVYYLGADSKRYVFPNSTTYFSWYKNFSTVVTIQPAELQTYTIAGNVTMRAGTKLVKITTDPSVYVVEPNGVLRKISSEAQASALYGTSWNKRIVDVSDSYFVNYTVGTVLTNGATPAGSLVKNAGSSAIYYYDGTNYRVLASEAAANANRFDLANVLTLTSTITASGSAITGAEAELVKTSGNATTGTVITGSGLMVSLNSNTAAASTIIGNITSDVSIGQALADLGSFNFTAANDGAVTVKTLKLKRIGISADTALQAVYLYDGVTRLTDSASFSNGSVSFSSGSGLITVAAGQTKTITVKADVRAVSGNIGVAINAASDVTSTGANVSGSFPLQGNLMSMTSAEGLSEVVLTNTLSVNQIDVKAGNTNSIVWSETANVTNKAVDFKYIAFKQVGSINSDDLANLSLYVDGTKVSTATLVNNDLAFNLATPVRLNTSKHTIELKADIIKGSSRTFSFKMQVAANAVFTDTNYNVNVAATGDVNVGPTFKISTGTLSVAADTAFTATEIVKTASNATLSRFKVKAYGEDIKVNTLTVDLDMAGTYASTEKVNDLAVVVNGNQVGSSQSVVATSSRDVAFGSSNLFVIPAGTEVIVEVKGSLSLDSNSTSTTRNIQAHIKSISAIGVTSYADANIANEVYSNNILAIVSGSMTIAKNSALQDLNVSKNAQKVKIASYIISAGSAEGVNISNLRVNFKDLKGSATSTSLNNISNVYVNENTTPVNPQSANDFNVNLTIAKSQSKTVDVYADLGDIKDGEIIQTSLAATFKTDVTMTFGTKDPVDGQVITIASGALAIPTLVSNAPASALVLGGTTPVAATYKFVATNGAATINELVVNVTKPSAATSSDSVSTITIGSVTAPVISGVATLSGLNIVVPAGNQGLNVEVKAAYNTVTSAGQGGINTNNDVLLTLSNMKFSVNGVQTDRSVSVPSNVMVLVAAIPTFALATDNPAGQTAGFAGGVNDMLKFTVTNGSATSLNLKQVALKSVYASTTFNNDGVSIYDANGTLLGTSTPVSSGTAFNVTFANDYVIAPNSSATFRVSADTSAVVGTSVRIDLSAADNTFASVGAVSANKYAWNDGTTTAGNYLNGYLFKNLPLSGKPFVK